MTRPRSRWIALGMLVAAAIVPAHSFGDDSSRRATEDGLQVQVDPETGTYSMPSPGTLAPAAPARSAERAGAVVITPVQSPPGGFKITVPDREQQ